MYKSIITKSISCIKRSFSTNASQIFQNSCYSKIDYKIHQNASVQDAVVRFAAFDIGCLAVVDDSQKLVGIFSEGDYIKRVASVGKDSSIITVKDVCTLSPNILIAKPEDTLEQCMSKMHFKNIRHLIIVDNFNIKGLISIKDLFRETIVRNELLIKRLSNLYIGKGAFFGSE